MPRPLQLSCLSHLKRCLIWNFVSILTAVRMLICCWPMCKQIYLHEIKPTYAPNWEHVFHFHLFQMAIYHRHKSNVLTANVSSNNQLIRIFPTWIKKNSWKNCTKVTIFFLHTHLEKSKSARNYCIIFRVQNCKCISHHLL